ncbi:MAG: 4Fe-4S dicluster domain-containing protein [Thermodesulfobacteriota bacterium]
MRFDFHSRKHIKTEFIKLNPKKCEACGECIKACPNNVIGMVDIKIHKHAHIDSADLCEGCRKCIKACVYGAIN